MRSKPAFILRFMFMLLASTAIGVVPGAPAEERIGGQVAEQHLIDHAPPAYPPLARAARIQGDVLLDVTIGEDGTVESIKAVSGHPLLIPAAIDAVKQWRYKPFTVDGKAVRVSTQVKVNFQLDETAGGSQTTAEGAVEPPPCYIGELRVGKAPDGSTAYECAVSKMGTLDSHLCFKWGPSGWDRQDMVPCHTAESRAVPPFPTVAQKPETEASNPASNKAPAQEKTVEASEQLPSQPGNPTVLGWVKNGESCYYGNRGPGSACPSKDYAKALTWFQMAAERGDSTAMGYLGNMYRYGQGVVQDYGQALDWYTKSAERGDAGSQFDVANIYYRGEGIPKDYAKALYWFSKSAERGDANSQAPLGVMYEFGKGVTQDYRKAANLYTEAAQQGNALAQFNLGNMYKDGEGVKQDSTTAYYWYQAAAGNGFADDQAEMAAQRARNNADLIRANVDFQRLADLRQVMHWQPREGQTPGERENQKEFETAIHGIHAGQSQATVKALLLSRGFPSWNCDGRWDEGEWQSSCSTFKAWVALTPRMQTTTMDITFVFSVYRRVRHIDPDTQVSHLVDQKTDRLLDVLVPRCSEATGTTWQQCDSPLH